MGKVRKGSLKYNGSFLPQVVKDIPQLSLPGRHPYVEGKVSLPKSG